MASRTYNYQKRWSNHCLNASFSCGLAIEDPVPDHSTLSRFRGELTSKKAYDRILKKA